MIVIKHKIILIKVIALVIGLLLVIQTGVFGQNTNPPKLSATGKNISDFVPKDWKVAETIEGDLNGDNIADSVLVLQGANQELVNNGDIFESNQKIVDEKNGETKYLINKNPYILAVLINSNNQYQLAGQNNKLIPGFNVEGSIYNWNYSASIEDHNLIIVVNGRIPRTVMDLFGNTSKVFSFQLRNNRLVLVKAQNNETSQTMLPVYGNGYRSVYEIYDFLYKSEFFTYKIQKNNQPVTENLYKIKNLISFEKVTYDFSELKKLANVQDKNKKAAAEKKMMYKEIFLRRFL